MQKKWVALICSTCILASAAFVVPQQSFVNAARLTNDIIMPTSIPETQVNVECERSSAPVAKFAVDKETYHIGETITYTNLSYDPDSESVFLSWTGKQEAFFEAGTHEVSLVATDKNGNVSEAYTKEIKVTDRVMFTEFEYGVYFAKAGSFIKASDSIFNSQLLQIPESAYKTTYDTTRKLLVSDSPENIRTSGILYEDHINGKVRLYANHVNKSGGNIQLAILATNNGSAPVTLVTNNVGEALPSQNAMLLGSEAAIDFLLHDEITEEFVVQPGETIIYRQFPTLFPEYGINAIVDVEATGQLQMTFAADTEASTNMLSLSKLAYEGHVRGTFEASAIHRELNMSKMGTKKLQRLVIGDGIADSFVNGYDVQRNVATKLSGNYGVVYDITIHNPHNMAVLLMARGGTFKGAFKVNGQFVRVPISGVLAPMDGFVSLGQTSKKDKKLTIEFIPPAGSSFPLQLVFYPLDNRIDQMK
ncbi:MAG TPA: copper amine oxidase N-terminal domain-containing protein [Candidatus Paenibacillus intestinavium]|nr:copper amine oxidase N-terminal domain-containing protein [Candidatus Paenibacillus intestinavium]